MVVEQLFRGINWNELALNELVLAIQNMQMQSSSLK